MALPNVSEVREADHHPMLLIKVVSIWYVAQFNSSSQDLIEYQAEMHCYFLKKITFSEPSFIFIFLSRIR